MSLTSQCIENIAFTRFDIQLNFQQAQQRCTQLNGNLATVNSLEKFNRVVDLIEDQPVWIGLIDEADIGGIDSLRFFFVDGNLDQSFYQVGGQFPWLQGQPNDNGGDENCVNIESDELLFDDSSCDLLHSFVCEFACEVDQECINDVELTFFASTLPFTEARKQCQDISGDLVTLNSENFFNRGVDLAVNAVGIGNVACWTGLVDDLDIGGTDPTRFNFVDGNPDKSFYQVGGIFPWREDRPNDFNDDENCVALNGNGIDVLFNDANCNTLARQALCQVSCLQLADEENVNEDDEENNSPLGIIASIFGGVVVLIALFALVVFLRRAPVDRFKTHHDDVKKDVESTEPVELVNVASVKKKQKQKLTPTLPGTFQTAANFKNEEGLHYQYQTVSTERRY